MPPLERKDNNMPDLNTFISMVLAIVDQWGGRVVVAAGMTIVLAIAALTYIADRVFQK
jgi:hypothetical protein